METKEATKAQLVAKKSRTKDDDDYDSRIGDYLVLLIVRVVVVVLRPYSWSEVIHRAGDESIFSAFERERPRIVNNFAASALSGYELSSSSEKMNGPRFSNLAVVLESGNEYSDEDESSLRRLRLAIRNSHPSQAARTTTPLFFKRRHREYE